MYQQDWFMRQVESLGKLVAKLLLKKDSPGYEIFDEDHLTDTDMLYLQIHALLDEQAYKQAEELLFTHMNPSDKGGLAIALAFFAQLNAKSAEELEQHGYSREEVEKGIRKAAELYGLDTSMLR